MDNRTKELIAIGASIAANCQPCLEYHLGKARENGANEKEINEAIAVGRIVRKGAAGKMDRFASTIFQETETPKPSAATEEDPGCQLTPEAN